MFDIGWGELLLIGMVALIAIGPKELPGALRALGHWMGKIRRMAGEFQNQFQDAIREAELADLKKEVDEMATQAQSYSNFDPMADIRKDIEAAAAPPSTFDTPLSDTTSPHASSATPAADAPVPDTPPAMPTAGEIAPAADATTSAVPSAPSEPAVGADAAKPDAGRAA